VLVLRQGEALEQGRTADVPYRPRHECGRLLISSISNTASTSSGGCGAVSLGGQTGATDRAH